MEFRHLKFFIAVAQELSFTRAAQKLRIAQPHLSREVRQLEHKVGASLFVRDRRRVSLTPAGQAFLPRALRLLEDTSDAVHAAQRAQKGLSGRIRVGFSSSAGFGILPVAVRRFREYRPDVELELTEFNSDQQIDLVRTSGLDAGFLYPPLQAYRELSFERLVLDPLVAALPDGHALSNRARVPLRALADEPWIFFPRSVASRLHDEILLACKGASFTPRTVQLALKLSTICSLVASGVGVALVPATLMRLRLPRIQYRPLAGPPPRLPLSLVSRTGETSPALGAFVDIVRREARLFRHAEFNEPGMDSGSAVTGRTGR